MASILTNPLARAARSLLFELTRSESPVLEPYARQSNPIRARLWGLAGLVGLALLGGAYGFSFAVLPPNFLLFLIAPLALLGLVVIWALPDMDTAPTRFMVKCFLGLAGAAVLWPDYIAIALPGLPWISMRRLFAFPMAACLLVSLSVSAQFRAQMKEYLSAWPPLPKMLAGFVLLQAMSVPLSKELGASIRNFIDFQVMWTMSFVVGVYAFQRMENIRLLFKILLVSAIILCGIALAENSQHKVIWLDYIPSLLKVDQDALKLYTQSVFRAGEYRVKATFTNSLPFAEFMALVSSIILYYIIRSKSLVRIIILTALDALVFYVIDLSQARLGMIGFAFGHVVFGLMWALRRWNSNRVSLIGPAAVLAYPAFVLALAVAIVSISSLNQRFLGSQATAGSNDARKIQFRMAVPVVAKSPIFGYGPRQGGRALGYRSGSFLTIDSYILSMALDYGLVGFFFYYGMLLLAIWRAFQLLLRDESEESDMAMVALTILSIFILTRSVLSQEDNNWLPFMLMGVVLALVRRSQTSRNASDSSVRSSRPTVAVSG